MKTPLRMLACVTVFVGFERLAAAENDDSPPLTSDQIETLVAPIALYPDPLVALILPAATHPSDVVLASRFLARGGSPENVLSEPWDESVKALVRYREVVDYLDRNLDWTRRLGDCFINQPDDVMDAIQSVRARARAAGMLADSPQQEVVVESDEICILPTNPTVIYVPRYDPFALCGPATTDWYPRVWITFGVAYGVGPWLRYDCDWRARHVRIAQRPPAWYCQPDWRFHHRATDIAWTRWAPPSRHDRHFDHRDDGPNRHWIGASDTLARRDRPSDRDHRGDHTPRRDVRPGSPPPMVNPAPMTSSPVGPPVRLPAPIVRPGSDNPDRTPAPRDERRGGDRRDRNRDRQVEN